MEGQILGSPNDIDPLAVVRWGFMEGKFTNLTFANQWYNGQPLPLRDLGMLNTQYLILGAVGLRQLRVLRKSCGVTPLLSSYTTDCYGEYRFFTYCLFSIVSLSQCASLISE